MTDTPQTTRSPVGRLTQPEERLDWQRVLLLTHYEGNEKFWLDWIRLLRDSERLLEALTRSRRRSLLVGMYADHDLGWRGLRSAIDGMPVGFKGSRDGARASIRKSASSHLRNYRFRLVELASKYGLRCEWAPAWIHSSFLEWIQLIAPRELIEAMWDSLSPGLRRTMKDSLEKMPTERELRGRLRKALANEEPLLGLPSLTREATPSPLSSIGVETLLEQRWRRVGRRRLRNGRSGGAMWEPEGAIQIEVTYEPWPVDNWSQVEELILNQAKEQRQSILAAYRAAGFHHQDTEPRMQEHVRWLYLRIAPPQRGDRPMTWDAIAKTEDVPKDQQVAGATVKWTVEKLAKEMSVTLPAAPRGRPPRFAS